MDDDQGYGGGAKEPSRELSASLPGHNLQDRIEIPLSPETSYGAFADTYVGSFKADYLDEILESRSCIVCRKNKEAVATEVCNSCEHVWEGRVAIKQYRVPVQNRDQWKAICRELNIISRLSHPNILPFIGYLIRDDLPAIVTPWVEKGSLYDQIIAGTLSTSEMFVLGTACGIADGLAYLHSKAVVHGDLKSRNVLLSYADKPLLADFGLSLLVDKEMTATFTSTAGGRSAMRWIAPELCFGESISSASDMWAFGMVIYELLVHKLPYHETKLDSMVVRNIISGVHPSWPEKAATPGPVDIRRALRDLCEKCWATTPAVRPTSRDIVDKLDSFKSPPWNPDANRPELIMSVDPVSRWFPESDNPREFLPDDLIQPPRAIEYASQFGGTQKFSYPRTSPSDISRIWAGDSARPQDQDQPKPPNSPKFFHWKLSNYETPNVESPNASDIESHPKKSDSPPKNRKSCSSCISLKLRCEGTYPEPCSYCVLHGNECSYPKRTSRMESTATCQISFNFTTARLFNKRVTANGWRYRFTFTVGSLQIDVQVPPVPYSFAYNPAEQEIFMTILILGETRRAEGQIGIDKACPEGSQTDTSKESWDMNISDSLEFSHSSLVDNGNPPVLPYPQSSHQLPLMRLQSFIIEDVCFTDCQFVAGSFSTSS